MQRMKLYDPETEEFLPDPRWCRLIMAWRNPLYKRRVDPYIETAIKRNAEALEAQRQAADPRDARKARIAAVVRAKFGKAVVG